MIRPDTDVDVAVLEMRQACPDTLSLQHRRKVIVYKDAHDPLVDFCGTPAEEDNVPHFYFLQRRIPYPTIDDFTSVNDLLISTFVT